MKTEHPPYNTFLAKAGNTYLRMDTAICRVGDMHSENAQVHTVVSLLLWRWAQFKVCSSNIRNGYKQRRAERWLRMLRCAIKSKRLKFCRTESSFCMITPAPILPFWWGISFRGFAGKHFIIILRTSQIFALVTSTFLATWRRHSWASVSFGRGSKWVGEVNPSATYLFEQEWNWKSRLPVV